MPYGRLALASPAWLLRHGGHLHAHLGRRELADRDLIATPRDRDRRVFAARRLDQAGAFERAQEIERRTLAPAAQAAALGQLVEPRIVLAADRQLHDPHPAEPAGQRADQRKQATD